MGVSEIGERQSERVLSRLPDEPVMQRPAIGLAVVPGLGLELANRLADLVQGNVRRQRLADRNRDRVRSLIGHPPMTGRREDALAQAVEMHRDDRRVPALDDPLQPALKRRHHARPGDLALGEQADQFPRIECFAGFTKRVQDHLRSPARGDRDRSHGAEDPADDGPVEVVG